MESVRKSVFPKIMGALVLACVASGCSTRPPAPDNKEVQPSYRVAEQRYAPEGEYSRQGWVVPPYPIPGSEVARGRRFSQTHTISLSNVRVDEASRRVAGLFGYRAFIASNAAEQRLSLVREHGDIEQLAEALAREAKIRVVIDHETREMRVFARREE